MKQEELREKIKDIKDDIFATDKDVVDGILDLINQHVREVIREVIRKNTDREFGTTDFDGIAEDIIKLEQELK